MSANSISMLRPSPMHRACSGTTPKHTECVLAFLEHGVDVSIDAADPNEEDGRLTPLQMSDTNPLPIGLIQEWQSSGRKPKGAMSEWGAGVEDATIKEGL